MFRRSHFIFFVVVVDFSLGLFKVKMPNEEQSFPSHEGTKVLSSRGILMFTFKCSIVTLIK